MSALRLPALALSAILQMMPLVRAALPAAETTANVMAIVFRWGVGAAAILGGVQAVSGASTVITTGDITATNGVPTSTRLLTSPQSAGWWSASGTPPGVNLTQNGSRWYLDGTPTAVGAYSVALVAKSSSRANAKETTSKTISFTVVAGGGGNAPPLATSQSVSTAEDTAKAITLSGTDSNNDPLTYAIVNQPAHGTLTGTAPNVTYTPVANYNGSDSITFKVNDGTVDSSAATVLITVTAVNDPPVANGQSVATAEDTSQAITLGGSDVEGSSLTYAIVSPPAHGTLTGATPNVTYTPSANYNGSDSFTFKVNDGSLDSSAGTVAITVTAVNDAPVANAQSLSTPENTAKVITLTGSDAEGNSLTYAVVNQPTHGSLSGTTPNVTYTPAANYSGLDSFTFRVNDGSLDSAAATISISVSSGNSPPTAKAQNVTTMEDTSKAITLSGSDPNGDSLTYTVRTQPTKGTLGGTAPNLTYTPNANVNGSDSFTFKVNDGTVDSSPATISITVTAVNDAPVANAQSVTTAEDTPKTITLTGSDVEKSSLTYAIVNQPAHGSLSGTPPNVTYTPAGNYNGSDSLSFKVNDGSLDSPVASVSLTVTPVNDPPVAANLTGTAYSGIQVTLDPLSASVDPDGDSLSITSVSPTNGTAVISGGTTILITAANNFTGAAFVGYTISDGQGGTAFGVISLTVTAQPVTQFSIQEGAKTINPQTGLFDQAVTVTNTGSGTAAAVRLVVAGLRTGATLYNAAGVATGLPYAQFNAPLDPGESVTFHLEFYVPDRQPFSSSYSVEVVLPVEATASSNGSLAIDGSFMDRSDASNPRFTIEFATVPGHTYTIIYSDNIRGDDESDAPAGWKAVTPSITASSTRTQWHDDGPPKTDSVPGSGRFYRVIANH